MRTAGTSRLCIDRPTLPCNRAPRSTPKSAPRSTEWSEIGSRRPPANSGHPSRVYPALNLAYRTAPTLERENQPLNDRNSGIAAPQPSTLSAFDQLNSRSCFTSGRLKVRGLSMGSLAGVLTTDWSSANSAYRSRRRSSCGPLRKASVRSSFHPASGRTKRTIPLKIMEFGDASNPDLFDRVSPLQ